MAKQFILLMENKCFVMSDSIPWSARESEDKNQSIWKSKIIAFNVWQINGLSFLIQLPGRQQNLSLGFGQYELANPFIVMWKNQCFVMSEPKLPGPAIHAELTIQLKFCNKTIHLKIDKPVICGPTFRAGQYSQNHPRPATESELNIRLILINKTIYSIA